MGSFADSAKDGSVGGQMFACRSLIGSPLACKYEFVLLDSTTRSVPVPPVVVRLAFAVSRIIRSVFILVCRQIDVCLIFSSSGLSFKEKGLLVFIGKIFGSKVIFFPRSGLIKDDISKSSFNRRFAAQVIRRSDYVICQGTEWREFYKKLNTTPAANLVVIQNWIEVNKYSVTRLQRRYEPCILYLGWLEPYKGIWDLVKVSRRLASKGYSFKVNVYGHGSMVREIAEYLEMNNMGHYFFLRGWADEPQKMAALKEADIFVLPSYREGFPNALLEAMASGVPSIASKVGAVSELIDHGINGYLIDPGSQMMLEEYLIHLLEHEEVRTKFSKNGAEKVRSNHSVEKAWSKLSYLIEHSD